MHFSGPGSHKTPAGGCSTLVALIAFFAYSIFGLLSIANYERPFIETITRRFKYYKDGDLQKLVFKEKNAFIPWITIVDRDLKHYELDPTKVWIYL